ncbi:hypothetical protein HPB52_014698 [Rhipicephalus sanguineus]|uniref:Uncharacterized protein n=1 Tax=Rhipicephalus sanguineus TaxID=34632 RepID=A0A9D4SU37_RHISA|nr:hypothetical protein HPB52_014698 [Rhipicephalus sanguineus]
MQGQDILLWDTRRVRMEPRDMVSEDNTLNFPPLCHSKTSTLVPIGATAARQRLSQRHNLHTTNAVFTDAALDEQSLALAWYEPSTGEAKRYICRMDYATPTQAELLAIWTALQDVAAVRIRKIRKKSRLDAGSRGDPRGR